MASVTLTLSSWTSKDTGKAEIKDVQKNIATSISGGSITAPKTLKP